MISPDWQLQGARPILEDHLWIEPGEVIAEEQMIILPGVEPVGLRLNLRLEGKSTVWHASSVALFPSDAPVPLNTDAASVTSENLSPYIPVRSKMAIKGKLPPVKERQKQQYLQQQQYTQHQQQQEWHEMKKDHAKAELEEKDQLKKVRLEVEDPESKVP